MKKQLLSVALAMALLFYSNKNIAQAPMLGTAANFVLFSSVGAVGNTGISQITGNVGTNSGAITGFGNVNGVMHAVDGASAACAADLLTAYNQLNAAIPTFFPGVALGNGDTLFAGVNSIPGNTTLNLDLILDAENNPNAVFIFQIAGPLSTNSNSKVKLINGAQACNVFWKVEGLVSMSSGTVMRGTVIAHNAAIDISSGDTLEGRALAIAGAVTINGLLAYTPTGCGSPILTGPAAPTLASTACYAIFSGNGEVTNAGVTNVTGDIGTNVGLTSGYNFLLVNGMIHTIPDGSTAACASDLLNLYNYLNLLPYDIELLYPAQFGSSLVLTPHTYLMNAAATFTDTLYLNAEGNVNAVFVIQINGALSTTTFAKVKLTNGTQAKNVFWKVDGAVNINDYANLAGTIVCNNGAIAMNTGSTINGRILTTNGAVSTASITATISSPCSLLPVSWLYFNGKPLQENVLLEWVTTKEINSSFFTIEKSKDGRIFNLLANVNAGRTSVSGDSKYSYIDQQPYNLNFYRISQTDKDGRKTYFKNIQVKMNFIQSLKVQHYAEQNFIYIKMSGATPSNGSIQLYSMDGKKIISQPVSLTKEINTYKLNKALHQGIYLLTIEANGEKIYQTKVMVD